MLSGDSVPSFQASPSSCTQASGLGEGNQFMLVKTTPEKHHDHVSFPAQLQQQQNISSPLPQTKQQNSVYPPALASHEAVISNRDLFYDTLNKFHAALGTRLSIPTIGGKELDLHLLYVEVSSRGGLEQVIRERKWKEVTVVFHFPPTTTSASFVLRKYYISLLHHYEQVYFFGTQGPLVPPPISAPIPSQTSGQQLVDNGLSNNNGSENGELAVKKRRKKMEDTSQNHEADLTVPVGHAVSGVIDGKFERGYLVTVTVGTEKLSGILYHLPLENVTPQYASVSEMPKGIVSNSVVFEGRRRRRRRRKDEMPRRDPNAPKPNRSGYNFFFQEHRRRLKALYPDKDKELSKMIGELWNKQTEEERAIYQERGLKDKERYKKEMEIYRGGLKSQTCINGIKESSIEGAEDVLPRMMVNSRGPECIMPTADAFGRSDHAVQSISVVDTLGRPEQSLQSVPETHSYLQVEEEKPRTDPMQS